MGSNMAGEGKVSVMSEAEGELEEGKSNWAVLSRHHGVAKPWFCGVVALLLSVLGRAVARLVSAVLGCQASHIIEPNWGGCIGFC